MGLTQRAKVASGCMLGCLPTTTPNREQSGVLRPRGWMGNARISRKQNRNQGFLLAMDTERLQSFDGAEVP